MLNTKTQNKMRDKEGKELNVGDKVAILHKKYPSTTPTMQVGTITRIWNSICEVYVIGLNKTRHKETSIVKIQ